MAGHGERWLHWLFGRFGATVAIGVTIFVVFIATIIICFTCSCCCLYKMCCPQRRKPAFTDLVHPCRYQSLPTRSTRADTRAGKG